MDINPVPLAEAIEALRFELAKALEKKPQEGIGFEVDSINLELQVVAQSDKAGELTGGWSLLGWSAGGKAQYAKSDVATHTVQLTLNPIVTDGKGVSKKLEISAPGGRQK